MVIVRGNEEGYAVPTSRAMGLCDVFSGLVLLPSGGLQAWAPLWALASTPSSGQAWKKPVRVRLRACACA